MDRVVHWLGVEQEADVLPFNKRRNNSEIEIQTGEVEPVQLPPVRPPSVRPAAGASPRYSSSRPPAPMSSRALPPPATPSRPSAPPARPSTRPPISFRPPTDDNERTLMVAEKAPRRTLDLRQPKMPTFDEPSVIAPRETSFSDDEATRIHPNSSRSVLQMSAPSARRLLDESSGRIRSDVPPPPVSSLRVDEPRSAAAIDMSMTVGASASQSQQVTSSTKFNPGRPTAVWAAALVAVGVFTGLAAALVARGGTDNFVTASAALIDPAQGAAPQIVATPPQNVATTIAAAPVQTAAPQHTQGAQATAQAVSAALTPAASCAADVAPAAKAADTKVAAAPAVVADTKVADVKPAAPPPPVVRAAAPPVVRAAAPPVAVAPKPPVVAAAPKPAAAPVKPASKGSDMDSASAADALAKAQLEASLGR